MGKVGKPLAFKTPEELEAKVEEYFETDAYFESDGDRRYMPTMAGLALSLGIDRRTLVDYAHRDEYLPTIKKARARIEAFLERRLYGNTVTGVIFNLKNNFDWKDKQDINQDVTSGGKQINSWVVNPVSTEKDG